MMGQADRGGGSSGDVRHGSGDREAELGTSASGSEARDIGHGRG
jgi:hypothetical protein